MPSVRRFTVAIGRRIAALSASGVSTLAGGEPCTGFELTDRCEDDGGCPLTCVTCGRCAEAAEPRTVPVSGSLEIPLSDPITAVPRFPRTDPLDIPHVLSRSRGSHIVSVTLGVDESRGRLLEASRRLRANPELEGECREPVILP